MLFADEEHRQSGARAYLAARQADQPAASGSGSAEASASGSSSAEAAADNGASKNRGTVEKHVAAIETGASVYASRVYKDLA